MRNASIGLFNENRRSRRCSGQRFLQGSQTMVLKAEANLTREVHFDAWASSCFWCIHSASAAHNFTLLVQTKMGIENKKLKKRNCIKSRGRTRNVSALTFGWVIFFFSLSYYFSRARLFWFESLQKFNVSSRSLDIAFPESVAIASPPPDFSSFLFSILRAPLHPPK